MEDNDTKISAPKPKKRRFRFLRIIFRIILSLILLVFLLLLFIRSPWGQNIIVQKATDFVSKKTHTKVEIKKLFITFDGHVQLEELYLEDLKGDTLIYSKVLEANLPLWAMIRGEGIGVDGLYWEGVRANVVRKDSISGFNFNFLIDAFASDTREEVQSTTIDTLSKPLNLVLGKFKLTDLDIVYNDAVTGIDSRFKIGHLNTKIKNTDLEHMNFEVSELTLEDSNIKFFQSEVPETSSPEDSPLPSLRVDRLRLSNVKADYRGANDEMKALVDIKEFYTEIPNLDLKTQQFDIATLELKDSDIRIYTSDVNKNTSINDPSLSENTGFEWPELQISVGKIDLEHNNFNYTVGESTPKKNQFDPNAIELTDLSFKANDLSLKDKIAQLKIDLLSVKERSGLDLKDLSFKLHLDDKELQLTDLNTTLNNSSIAAHLNLNYQSLSALIDKPETAKVRLDVKKLHVLMSDIYRFQPELRANEYIKTLARHRINGRIKANGLLSDINVSNLQVYWNNTSISTKGRLKNLTKPNLMSFDLPRFVVVSKRSDVVQFVKEENLGVQLPEDLELKGSLVGNMKDVKVDALLTTTQGLVQLDAFFKNDGLIEFGADLSIDDYKLNELLQNEKLGPISIKLKTQGDGTDINRLNVHLETEITSFKLENYEIKDLKLIGDIKDGQGSITSSYKDYNIDMNLDAAVTLDSVAPEAKINFNLKGIDLKSLGLMERDVKMGMKFIVDFKGNAERYDVKALVDDGVVVYDNKTYIMGDINASAHVRPDSTAVTLDNKMIHLLLESNTDPKTFSSSLKNHVLSYFFRDRQTSDSLTTPVNLRLRGTVIQSPLLNEVFLVNAKRIDTINISVDYNERKRELLADITAPYLNYNDMELDSLAFTMRTDKDLFDFDLGFKKVKAGPLYIHKTKFSGHQTDGELSLSLIAYHDDEKLIQLLSKITGSPEELRFHMMPDEIILNKELWQTPENNEMLMRKKEFVFNDFRFFRDNQSVEVTDKNPNIKSDHIAINFNNFKLSQVLSYFNPDKELAKGNLKGDFIIAEPFTNTGIITDLEISELHLMDVDMGTLTLDAKSKGLDTYDFKAHMKGGEIDLDLFGDYVATENENHFDIDLDLKKFNMNALKGLSQGEIIETDGSFSGNFKINGSPSDPKYSGELTFNDADFKVAKFNAAFNLKRETLSIDNSGLVLKGFTIRDENSNTFIMAGKIGTESFINPTFDLQVLADNFQILNAKKEDNDFLYGRASLDGSAKITGDLEVPKIDMDLTVTSDTDVTYVLPSATANIEERDGVVIFVNRDNPDDILTRVSEKTATLTGIDISALLKIGKNAAVTIIIDKETGDNFKVSGEGDFTFSMKPNGNMQLSGVYEISGGHYEMSLYNLVNRKFSLVKGSRVSWSGSPFDAKMDVKALYEVETSASSLMAPVLSGDDPATKGKYRQVLPFLVYLNIDGELLQPKIAFSLDMPEDSQGSIGGQVYGRVQQLNQQEDELNKQVFSLLVLNRFYPNPGSDGGSGGVASIARDNLNDAVSDQLNMFSDKLLGNTGFELNFGIDSYTDYQGTSPEERTQLDIAAQKKLFDDRLIVSVGSEVDIQGSREPGEEMPIIGNVSIEYLITENGRYRLKGFRRNEFENVIDGQTIISGIALIFTQEFNKFDELWEAILKGQTEQEKKEKAERKAARKAAKEALKTREEETNSSIKSKTN